MKKRYIFVILIILILIGFGVFYYLKKDNVVETKKESIEYFQLFHEENFGVIDKKGNIIIEPIYSNVVIPRHSKDIFFCYSDNIRYKVLNKEGTELFTEFEEVTPIIGSLVERYEYRELLRYKEQGKYGLIDTESNRITRAIYDKIEALDDDYRTYRVVLNDKVGLLDPKGKVLLKPRYDDIVASASFNFSADFGSVGYELKEVTPNEEKYGFASNTGKVLLKPRFESVIKADISSSDYYIIVQEKGRKGLYKNNKRIIDSKYQEIICGTTSIVVKEYGKYGLYSLEGQELINPRFDQYKMFGKYVTLVDGEKEYTYDGVGNQVAGSEFMIISDVPDKNYIIVSDSNNKKTLIIDGRVVQDRYDEIIYAFDDFFIFQKDEKMGVLQVNKGVILDPEYDYINNIYGTNIIKAIKGKESTMYNKEMYAINFSKVFNEEKIPNTDILLLHNKTDSIYLDNDGYEVKNTDILDREYYAKKEGNKWGFVDKNNNFVLKPKYDFASEFNEYGFASVRIGDKWGVINNELKEVVKPKYEFKERTTIPQFVSKYLIEENVKGLVLNIDKVEVTKVEE